MFSLPRLSGSGMAWPVMESEAEFVLVFHELRRSGLASRARVMEVH